MIFCLVCQYRLVTRDPRLNLEYECVCGQPGTPGFGRWINSIPNVFLRRSSSLREMPTQTRGKTEPEDE